MLLSEFDFPFEPSLVADQPVLPRDQARLMVIDQETGIRLHRRIADLPQLLQPGDLLVVNDTKVMPARVTGWLASSGKEVELLFVEDLGEGIWTILMKGRQRPGTLIEFPSGARGEILERTQERTILRMAAAENVPALMQQAGTMPLPPYIKRPPTQQDFVWYQTVFARRDGAIAAPTAGLHFTNELVAALGAAGMSLTTITLHVGPGTFRPVTAGRIHDHRMAAERVVVSDAAVGAIQRARETGNRVIAVGTTVVRALESAAQATGEVQPFEAATELFISPGFTFRVADAMITNFHLPRTTLLMLVSAFVGVNELRAAYREAVAQRYRFYSYGDAMLIGRGWRGAT